MAGVRVSLRESHDGPLRGREDPQAPGVDALRPLRRRGSEVLLGDVREGPRPDGRGGGLAAPVAGLARRHAVGSGPTYRFSTYDVADDPSRDGEWTVRAEGVGRWGIRTWTRTLMGEGYDTYSILVERREERPVLALIRGLVASGGRSVGRRLRWLAGPALRRLALRREGRLRRTRGNTRPLDRHDTYSWCPRCGFDLGDDLGRGTQFRCTRSGSHAPPGEPTVHWFEGIQTCQACGHRWEYGDSD